MRIMKIGIGSRCSDIESDAVIVTGAGGAAGVAIVQALAGRRRVVGADCDPCAVGMHLADESGLLPRADDADFVTHVAKLAQQTRATALICTVAEEIPFLCAGSAVLAEAGLATWLPTADTAQACTDKWRFAQICRDKRYRPRPRLWGLWKAFPGHGS